MTTSAAAAPRVLIVEDAESFVEALVVSLEREGFEISVARDGVEALERFDADAPDLVLLDVMLPRMSGIDVCRAIRARSEVPIIMVTAKSTELDTVVGLEVGADDYVSKPYRLRELVSRMRAVLRRHVAAQNTTGSMPVLPLGRPPQNAAQSAPAPSTTEDLGREIAPGSGVMLDRLRALVGQDEVLKAGDVTLDVGRHECIVRGEEVKLPLKEFELLEILLANAGRVVTRDTLIDRVWGLDYVGDTKTLDVHIKRLRSRIELDPSNPVLITTIRGVGYRLETPRR
ncbi:MAG: response regulator [Acidimicrobiales bacterium]|jgi:two-component system, OmpR family, response regulator RegX3